MPDTPHLRPAEPEEVAQALSHALRYDGKRRVHTAEEMMAQIAAEHLLRHPAFGAGRSSQFGWPSTEPFTRTLV